MTGRLNIEARARRPTAWAPRAGTSRPPLCAADATRRDATIDRSIDRTNDRPNVRTRGRLVFSGVVVASRRVRAISKRHCMRGVVVERARGGTIVEDSIEALEIERKRLLNALEHLERSCEALREVEEEDKEYADALRENARVEAEIRGKVYELSVKIVERRGTSREESKGGEGADVGTWV